MAPPTKKPKLSSPSPAPAPVLGEAQTIQHHPVTGRPVRTRRQVVRTDYVDPERTISHEDGESSDEEHDDDVVKVSTRKFGRHKSPDPPPMSPCPLDEMNSANVDCHPRTAGALPKQVSLTFNIPLGHQGPFIVNLDLASLLVPAFDMFKPLPTPNLSTSASISNSLDEPSSFHCAPIIYPSLAGASDTLAAPGHRPGFLDLPPEIRNIVYRSVFTAGGPIPGGGDFVTRNSYVFCRSAHFLRTCKQIYREGTEILYGENKFTFRRQPRERGFYYQAAWKEVGFKDVRVFLNAIGNNLALIRDMKIWLEDAAPSRTPDQNVEARRFVHDEILLECLALIGRRSFLQRLSLNLSPRRTLHLDTDYRFLQILQTIKADEVHIFWTGGWGGERIRRLSNNITSKMMRQKQLYNTKVPTER